jgi:Flp pilus assembly protein TadG
MISLHRRHSSPFLRGPVAPSGATKPRRSRHATQRGSTMIEFAFTFVITLILMFAMIDFARALYSYHFVNNAAREAARFASVRGQMCSGSVTPCPAAPGDITTYVNSIVPLGIDPGQVTVNSTVAANGETVCGGVPPAYPGCPVNVVVQYNFNYIFPVSFYSLAPVGFQAGTIMMSSTAQITDSR